MYEAIKKYFPIFVLPTIIAFLASFVVPFILGIYLSFCEFTTINDAVWVGLENYKSIVDDEQFMYSLMFTVAFTVVVMVLANVIAFTLGMLLTRGFKGTKIFRSAFFLPNLIGGIVLGYIFSKLIDGILYNTLEVTILYHEKYGFLGLVVLMLWQLVGYLMIIYIAGFQNVPGELIEAAKIDGATKWQLLRKVTIPMVMPSITICTFTTLTNSFKLFDQNLTLTAGNPSHKTEMLALNIYDTFYGRTGYEGAGQAKAVIFTIMLAVISIVQLSMTRKKEVQQ